MSAARPSSDSPTVPVDTLAKLFSLTAVRVQQLAADGIVVRAARGRYDLWASIRNYIRYLQERKVNQWDAGGDDGKGWARERERLTRAKADMAEIQARLLKGESHDSKAVEECWADMIANARAKLLAMPTKLAARLEGLDINERKVEIETAVIESLNELAEYDPRRVTERYVATHRAEVDAAAEMDGESVGGQHPQAVE